MLLVKFNKRNILKGKKGSVLLGNIKNPSQKTTSKLSDQE